MRAGICPDWQCQLRPGGTRPSAAPAGQAGEPATTAATAAATTTTPATPLQAT